MIWPLLVWLINVAATMCSGPTSYTFDGPALRVSTEGSGRYCTGDFDAAADAPSASRQGSSFEAGAEAPSASRQGSSRRGCTGALEASSAAPIAVEAASAIRGARTISSNGSTAARSISYEAA